MSPAPCASGEKPPSLAQPSVHIRSFIYRPFLQVCPLTTRAGPRSCPWSICFSFFSSAIKHTALVTIPANFNKDFPAYLLLMKVVFGVSGHSMSQWLNPGCYSFAKQSLCVIIWILRLSSLH